MGVLYHARTRVALFHFNCRDGVQLLPETENIVPAFAGLQSTHHIYDVAKGRYDSKQTRNREVFKMLQRNWYDCSEAWERKTNQGYRGDKAVR